MGASASECLRQDHRVIEASLDNLFALLERLNAGHVSGVKTLVRELRNLAAIHFAKEENVFYPCVRQHLPALLSQMDEQHADVRELEEHLSAMLADIPPDPDSRWLDELRSIGIEFHDRIQHHIVAEEEELLPAADARLAPEDQQRLAIEMAALGAPAS